MPSLTPTPQPPRQLHFASDPVRDGIELARWPMTARLMRTAPSGDGVRVLVLPGLLASDLSTRPLRAQQDARSGRRDGPRAAGRVLRKGCARREGRATGRGWDRARTAGRELRGDVLIWREVMALWTRNALGSAGVTATETTDWYSEDSAWPAQG